MKLFFAAPLSGFPSDPTALGAQVSRLHLARKLFFAAPASGLPSFPTALLAHVSCADAKPIANAVKSAANINLFIFAILVSKRVLEPIIFRRFPRPNSGEP
jgi:hypothetical protein